MALRPCWVPLGSRPSPVAIVSELRPRRPQLPSFSTAPVLAGLVGLVAGVRAQGRRQGVRGRVSVHAAADEETPTSSCACGTTGPRRSFLQALTAFNSYMATSRAANAKMDVIDMGDPNKCIYCFGDGFLTCWRCSGTKKMTEIDDPSKTRDCSECEATGYKPCGTCQTTGLSPKLVKLYARDEKFRKIMARLRKTKCDEDGRAKIKRVMTTAIAEVEAKQAASEGRDAMILKVPEAPAPEASGTWIGS